MSQEPSNWKSMLADEEQWNNVSDSYILETDDPYSHYEEILIKYTTTCK